MILLWRKTWLVLILVVGLAFSGLVMVGTVSAKELKKVPPEYSGQKMPAGWWTDPQIVAAGKKVYEGRITYKKKFDKGRKKCFKCHGVDGKPKIRRARDFRAAARMDTFSEAYWYWRIAEGVPKTKMEPWKGYLTEEQIWQVMTYEHTFSHGGKPSEHNH